MELELELTTGSVFSSISFVRAINALRSKRNCCCVVLCASLAEGSRRERQAVPLLDERCQSPR